MRHTPLAAVMDSRRVCQACNEELALTAYYRHQNGNSCPAKRRERPPSPNSDENCFEKELTDMDLDSSFSFGDCESVISRDENTNFPLEDNEGEVDSMFEESSNEENSSVDDGEIWEDLSDVSDEETGPFHTNEDRTVFAICLFLNFFQLFYKVSERAILALLLFLRSMLTFFGLQNIARLLPRSLQSIKKALRINLPRQTSTEYVVCPKCNSLYLYEHCVSGRSGREESRLCDFVEYPDHPQVSRRSKCNTPLLKKITVGKGAKLVPRKVFVYHSIISTLNSMINRKDFLCKCEHWRNRKNSLSHGLLGDVYEGRVWNESQCILGQSFLSQPNNLSLMLNVDWFNPFDETPYSAGVIYFVIQNLPRSERFKFENIILAGIIPGPREPKKHINTFLSPVVKDLQRLYTGVVMQNPSSFCGTTLIRAIVSCVSCDLPATRKVCGFYSFSSLYGCSKCLKQFVTTSFGSKPDYSGFDTSIWPSRDLTTHKAKAYTSKEASTASAQIKIEQSYGIRYSVLLSLPYFDVIRHHVVDPMHALFLGIAKHTVKVWRDLDIITLDHLSIMQEKVDNMIPPPKVGRIPRKIQSGFMAFTADEWKNWIVLYSPYVLLDLLPERHYQCWCCFVDACQLICQPLISRDEIDTAHDLLIRFCLMFETLYGKNACTPNMHMVCHLRDIMLDYGPVYGYWCFSFERYNGMLESMHKSWINPEKQLLEKFIDLQLVNTIDTSITEKTDFLSVTVRDIAMLKSMTTARSSGSADQMTYESLDIIQQISSRSGPTHTIDPEEKKYHKIMQPMYEKCLTDQELQCISHTYKAIYPNIRIVHIPRLCKEFKSLNVNGDQYISEKSRSQKSPTIFAHWPSLVGNIDTTGDAPYQIGNVVSFLRHQITLDTETGVNTITTLLAYVKWYENHPKRNFFHHSIIVSGTHFQTLCNASFVPVARRD